MQVSVEQLEGLERRLTVQVPAETVDQEVRQRLQSLSRRVRLDGFRPGKVPVKVVKRMYGTQVRQEVLGELMESSFRDALEQEQLRPVGGPKVEPVSIDEGADLEYRAVFEIIPEFVPTGLEGHTVKRPTAEVTEADIDNMIETLRKQRTEWNTVERAAQTGDRVTLSFEGTIDGEEFPGNKGENAEIVLGQGNMMASFEQELMGRHAEEQHEFDLTFPETHPSEQLAGKTAHFKVSIHQVAEPLLPEVNEDFARAFGVTSGDIAELRRELRENMERELRDAVNAKVKRQVMDALLSVNDIPVPRAMIDEEIETLAEQARLPKSSELDEAEREKRRQLLAPEAQRRVALGLIMSRLVTMHELKVDGQRVQQRLEHIASSYEDAAEVIHWYQQNPRMLEGVHAMVLEDQVVEMLLSEVQIEEQAMSFDDVMRPVREDRQSTEQSVTEESA